MIRGATDIRDAYRSDSVARDYICTRFQEPLGALLHTRQLRALKRTFLKSRPEQVLEIAPGPARLTLATTPLLRRRGFLVDASSEMLNEARRRLEERHPKQWHYAAGDAFSLPFRQAFDLVYTFRLIRHFDRDDRLRLYDEVRRVLRPSGILVFDAVNRTVSAQIRTAHPDRHEHYDALLTPPEIASELAEAGFHVESLEGVQHHYGLLYRMQVLLAPRSRTLAKGIMAVVDRTGGEPLEWVVTCRRA